MLTAIQDFISDTFCAQGEQEVEILEVGDFFVWMERGPLAVLAAAVHGTAPDELRVHLRKALESIHEQYAEALESFDGDTEAFKNVHPILESLLRIPAAAR